MMEIVVQVLPTMPKKIKKNQQFLISTQPSLNFIIYIKMINFENLMIDLFNFHQSLALNLTMKGLIQIKDIQKKQQNLQFVETNNNQEDELLDAYFNDFKTNGEYKKLIRSCIQLTSKGQNNSFAHKSIQEFYVEHFLLKIFDNLKIMDDNDFKYQLQTYKWENTCAKLKQKDLRLSFSSKYRIVFLPNQQFIIKQKQIQSII
ncbi:unnamed protein product [Paramecium sonneborni]|uniref:Uncharacterized protein n=1 Tax=Paramecium sonneborni TaxID=65129 RepID=A0A8S1PJT9_9CILI|nr:unnamed protein product [Paramecium sonneborni]